MPRDYALHRFASERAFITGKPITDFPKSQRQELTPAQCTANHKWVHKVLTRVGEAYVARCYDSLRGSGAMTQLTIEKAWADRKKAIESECMRACGLLSNTC